MLRLLPLCLESFAIPRARRRDRQIPLPPSSHLRHRDRWLWLLPSARMRRAVASLPQRSWGPHHAWPLEGCVFPEVSFRYQEGLLPYLLLPLLVSRRYCIAAWFPSWCHQHWFLLLRLSLFLILLRLRRFQQQQHRYQQQGYLLPRYRILRLSLFLQNLKRLLHLP